MIGVQPSGRHESRHVHTPLRTTVDIADFQAIRDETELLAAPLTPEDQQIQSMPADEHGELSGNLKRVFDKVQSEVEVTRYQMRLRMADRDEWLEETKETLAR